MTEFEIHSRATLESVILRTAFGYRWEQGHVDGALPYLNRMTEDRLFHLLEKGGAENGCIRTCDALEIAFALKQEMVVHARRALMSRHCPILAQRIPDATEPPSRTWLNTFCNTHDLKIVEGRSMESVRRLACDGLRVIRYFSKWAPWFNRDSRLIFGADETDMSPGNRFKVITTPGRQGTTEEEDDGTHLTAMCAHSASGTCLPYIIILPKLKKLPEELSTPSISANDIAWFCATPKGWMNEAAFYIWSMHFCNWLSQYRAARLPDNLKQAQVLLVLDGHSSRRCPEALKLFKLPDIAVVCLPRNTTHVLQAFDALLASSLKVNFRRFLLAEKRRMDTDPAGPRSHASVVRLMMVKSFLRAWTATATPDMCSKPFEVVGICPLDPDRVLQNPFVVQTVQLSKAEKDINNQLLTDDQVIRAVEQSRGKGMQAFPDVQMVDGVPCIHPVVS